MPALFIGHGSPMYAIEPNQYTQAWANLAKKIPKPTAILMISAHWLTRGIWITAMAQPKTIHDFGGFPQALFDIEYPAPGSPGLAQHIKGLLSPQFNDVTLEESEWGIDHGSWSILKYMYPQADIPVVQMSIDASLTPEQHVALGRKLQILRDENILIISSGNIVHNLQLIAWKNNTPTPAWANQFNDFFKTHLLNDDLGPLIDWQSAGPDAHLAIPSSEHYLPALYTFGLKKPSESASIFTNGIEMSSISMLSFVYGMPTTL
jgi:4,5-DOPA dioxygenase extradiol